MTTTRETTPGTPFDIPVLPTMATIRDRHDEIAERSARLRDEGYRDGYQNGQDAAARYVDAAVADHRSASERFARASAVLEAAADELRRRDGVGIADLEREAIELAVELAVEIVGRELAVTDEPVLDALQRAARLVPDRGEPTLRVHPDDASAVRDLVAAEPVTWTASARVVADGSIERGGCVVDVGACRIDAQIGTAIERLRAALR